MDDFAAGAAIGFIVMGLASIAFSTPKSQARETECSLRVELAVVVDSLYPDPPPPEVVTLAIVQKYPYCLKYLPETTE